MQVLPATEADIEFLSMLSREVQQMHANALPRLFKQSTPEAYAEDFFRHLLVDPDSFILVASHDGQPVGFVRGAILREPETVVRHAWERLHCKYIAVRPGHGGRGCGHALIQATVAFAKSRGLDTITGDVWSFNTRMKAFLAKEGHVSLCESQTLDVFSYE
jgi:ribosomal protein S18 acetylase RimI-like enzyme